ncbi:MAG: thioredoxin family protein [Patescibacteria group bacterium]|nr:thioredoxin family protein [Patescibacteria group bacterium]
MNNNDAKIEVLGSGCPTCERLYKITEQAVYELDVAVKVDYVKDIQRIVQMGLIQSPVLAINGKPALVGFTPDIEKIKKVIRDNL